MIQKSKGFPTLPLFRHEAGGGVGVIAACLLCANDRPRCGDCFHRPLDPARIQGNGPKVFNRYILPGTRYSLIQQYTCISVGHGKHDLCLHLQSSAPDSPSHGSLRSSRRSRGGESARRPILGQLQALTEKFKELSCINHFKFSLRDDAFKGSTTSRTIY